MSFPVIETYALSNSPTAVVITSEAMPSGIVAGNILVWLYSSLFNVNPATPSGWTSLSNIVSGALRHQVMWKIADGTETTIARNTGGSAQYATMVLRISGHDSEVEMNSVTGTAFSPLSPTWGSSDTLWLAVQRCRRGDGVFTAGSGYTLVDKIATNAADASTAARLIYTAKREFTSATETPSSFTYVSGSADTFTVEAIAIKGFGGAPISNGSGFTAWF